MKRITLALIALAIASVPATAARKPCLKWEARSSVTGKFVPMQAAVDRPRETQVFCSKRAKN